MTTKTLLKLQVNGKSVSALVCLLGSAAFLCNLGTNESSTGFAAMRTALSGGGRIGMSDRERADALMDRMLSVVAEEGERDLKTATVLEDGYYTSVGAGVCVDSHGHPYDHVSNPKNDAAKCAQFCGRNLLLCEHRGFEYNTDNLECRCLFDDHMIPRPLQKKSDGVTIAPHGKDEIVGNDDTGGGAATNTCYQKNEAKIGSPLDSYVSKACDVDDGEVLDYASFTAFEAEKCAEVCGRFSLLETHKGFTVTIEGHCRCLFKNGELPTERKLSNSGADRYDNNEEGYTFTERYGQFLTPAETLCYDRKGDIFASADVATRLAPPTNNHVFINEFHFRNYDTNEPFVRIVGPKGEDASPYAVIAYLGRDGTIHKEQTHQLTGTFDSSDNHPIFGSVKLDLASTALRKGKQGGDGLALVNTVTNECIQFLSYSSEISYSRSFVAAEGICAGKASVPIPQGVTEARDVPVGKSLQLSGASGNKYDQFTWTGPLDAATGTANAGQTLTAF